MTPSITIAEASYKLRQCQERTTKPTDSADILKHKLITYRLLALYQQFFPNEFASSRASLYPNPQTEGHSDREIEFLERVNQHLFPIHEWVLETAYEERISTIPVIGVGVDLNDEEGLEYLRPGWQILLPMSADGRYVLESLEAGEWYESEFGISFLSIVTPDAVDEKRLRKQCRQAGEPIKYLPLTLKVIDHCTGNIWLDAYDGDYFDYSHTHLVWSSRSINYLTRQWQQKESITSRTDELIDWLEEDLRTHFQQLLVLWNQSRLS